MSLARNAKVGVIGGGISGLSFTYFLLRLRPDIQFTIFEKNSAPGGWIKTDRLKSTNPQVPDILLEKGPRTLRGVSDGTLLIVDILRQLGLGDQVEVMKASSVANRKWLLDVAGNMVQVPSSFASFAKFLTSDITDGVVKCVLKEPFIKAPVPSEKPSDESIRSFFSRRFGSPALADNILSAVMHGIYSGDVSKLSVKATLPRLLELEQNHGSIIKGVFLGIFSKKHKPQLSASLKLYETLLSPDASLDLLSKKLKQYPILRLHDGLQTFPLAMARYLQTQPNVVIKYNSNVTSLDLNGSITSNNTTETFNHIRYTLSTHTLERIIPDSSVRELFSRFEHSSIFLANVYAPKGGLIPEGKNGFGLLVPIRNKNPESLLGIIFDSDCESDAMSFFNGKTLPKVPYQKITMMFGGHYFTSRGVPSNEVNVKITKKVLQLVLNVDLSRYNIKVRDENIQHGQPIDLDQDDLLISFNLHENCIPQYNVGFLDNLALVQKEVHQQSTGKVTIGGTSLGKAGVPDCVMNSLEAALSMK